METRTDEAFRVLVERARAGDGACFEELLEQHLPALRAFVRLRMGPALRARETTCDILQSVWREVLQDLHFEVRDRATFRHWVFETALRKILDKQRHWTAQKRDVRREAEGGDGPVDPDGRLAACYSSITSPSQRAELRDEVERLERAFDQLPPDYREVVTLARIVELPYAEIAKEMGRTEDSIRNLLARALARLGSLLAD